MTNENGRTARVQKLAPTFQHLAEVVRALAEAVPRSAWCYFLSGMAFAHVWDAGRVR